MYQLLIQRVDGVDTTSQTSRFRTGPRQEKGAGSGRTRLLRKLPVDQRDGPKEETSSDAKTLPCQGRTESVDLLTRRLTEYNASSEGGRWAGLKNYQSPRWMIYVTL